jgi:predicted XRE-type DNA-binding protein
MKHAESIEVEDSCGNVFADLGLPDADERLAKAELAREIRAVVKARSTTLRLVGQTLGLTHAEAAELVRGKLADLSRARLERVLATFQAPDRGSVRLTISRRSPESSR